MTNISRYALDFDHHRFMVASPVRPTRFWKPSRSGLQSDDTTLHREQLFFVMYLGIPVILKCIKCNQLATIIGHRNFSVDVCFVL